MQTSLKISNSKFRIEKQKTENVLQFILFFWCCIFCSTTSFTQETTKVNFTTKNGLPSSQVYDIIQDDFGFLWFATDKGLSRYDGYSFHNYTTEQGLPNNVVFDFHKRPNGEIWCTTISGELFAFSGQKPNFRAYEFNDTILKYSENLINYGLFFNGQRISIVYQHTEGFLTLSDKGKVLSKPNNKIDYREGVSCVVTRDGEPFFFWDNTSLTYSRSLGLSDGQIKSYKFKDPGSDFEALSLKNLQFFGSNSNFTWIAKGREICRSTNNTIISSGVLNNSEIWVGYRYGGVEVFDQNGIKQVHFLKDKSVTQLYLDHEGNYWVSTLENGVFKIPNAGVNYIQDFFGEKVSALETNEVSDLFIGLDNGSVYKYSGVNNNFCIYRSKPMKAPVKLAYHNGVLNFSSDGVYKWNQANGNIILYDIGESNYVVPYKEELLYGIGHTVFGEFDHKSLKGVVFKAKRMFDVCIFMDRIYGGNANGLYTKQNIDVGAVRKVLGAIRINDLNVFNNQLVLATNGKGLVLLDKDEKVRYRINTKTGLNSDFIAKTYAENDSVLWVCTNRGLNKITFKKDGTYGCIGMTTEEGLLSNEVWDLIVKNDTVWVGTQMGVNYFALDLLHKKPSKPINYFLQWIAITGKIENMPVNREFSHDQNEFTFEFIGLSFHTEEDFSYRYRLAGWHQDWHYTTSTTVNFSALPPGSYNFIVQVKGENDSWKSNELSYNFTILAPFWQRWWFILLVVLCAVGILYVFFKVRILTYNRDIVREMMIYIMRKIRREQPSVRIKHNGNEINLRTKEIHFLKTDGNYLEVHTKSKKYFIRSSVKKFLDQLPDSLEFIQVHRSYIVRLEHVQQMGKKELVVLDQKIPVGRKFQDQLGLLRRD